MSVNCQIIILSLEKLKLAFCREIPAASFLRLDLFRGIKMSFKLVELAAGDNITRRSHDGMLVVAMSLFLLFRILGGPGSAENVRKKVF